LIVGQAVTQETNDKRQLQPMVQTIVQQADQTPVQLLADRAIARTRIWARWATHRSTSISRRRNRSMARGRHRVRGAPCPRPRRAPSGWPGSC
jgi:hypothetical protein